MTARRPGDFRGGFCGPLVGNRQTNSRSSRSQPPRAFAFAALNLELLFAPGLSRPLLN